MVAANQAASAAKPKRQRLEDTGEKTDQSGVLHRGSDAVPHDVEH